MHIWLSNQIGTFAANIAISLIFCIMIITTSIVIIIFLNRLNAGNFNIHRKKHIPRLTICDTIMIDRTHRLILVRRDDTEHLILIGGSTNFVIESNIIDKHIKHKSTYKQKEDTQPISVIPETKQNSNLTEKIPFSVSEIEYVQSNIPTPFTNHQHLKDSVITAEVEGRQEPSLFIPTQKNKI
ncbi:flagellar biosynthetic protein FliO [Bartonella sp. B35(2025)]